jgi:hypothetical protein
MGQNNRKGGYLDPRWQRLSQWNGRTHQAADAAEAVDAYVAGAGGLGAGVGGVDDVDELRLERGAADEEAVDVGLGRQLVGVLGCWVVGGV